jgi:SAM-dependent methyltransferase
MTTSDTADIPEKHWPPEPRVCPICDGTDRRRIYRQYFSEMSAGSLFAGYDVVVCAACGLVYADNIPSQAAFDAHYRDMSKYERQESGCRESQFDITRFRAMAEIVARVQSDHAARILDVGCAIGGMLAALKALGYTRLLGVDPAPSCVASAAEIHGIEVVTGTLANLPVGERKFDLIVLSNILEHVRDLKPALLGLCEILTENGMFYVQVPDASRFANRDDAPFQEFSTEHINFFSAVSLANLMRELGFRAVLSENNASFQDQGALLPIVDAVFQRVSHSPLPLDRDEITEPDLQQYISDSQKVDDRIRQTIDEILARGEEIIVWGVGTHTLRLLSTSRLKDAKIAAFVDSNPRYQAKTLQGAPIIAPAELHKMRQAILVSSRVFQRNIEDQIRQTLKLDNRVYTLYDL